MQSHSVLAVDLHRNDRIDLVCAHIEQRSRHAIEEEPIAAERGSNHVVGYLGAQRRRGAQVGTVESDEFGRATTPEAAKAAAFPMSKRLGAEAATGSSSEPLAPRAAIPDCPEAIATPAAPGSAG